MRAWMTASKSNRPRRCDVARGIEAEVDTAAMRVVTGEKSS